MMIVGLTGSIGMGKSTTADFFKKAGYPVYNADAVVHALYQTELVISLIKETFPDAIVHNQIDRVKLSQIVLELPDNMKKLEAIIHPLVRKSEEAFIADARQQGAKIAILDIPLLFETDGIERVDAVVVASALEEVQRARVLARPNMTEQKFAAILAKQLPDKDKRARADFIIDTGKGFESAQQQVTLVINKMLNDSQPKA